MNQNIRWRLKHAPSDKWNAVLSTIFLAVFDVSVRIALGGLTAGQTEKQGKQDVPARHSPNEKEISHGRVPW